VPPQLRRVGSDSVYEPYECLIDRANTWLRDQADVTVVNLQSILVQKDQTGQSDWCDAMCARRHGQDGATFSYLAPTVWNGLPLNIRLSPTLDTFKRRLKTRLFKIANQHLYHAAHLVTASASDSVPLLHVHAL